MPLAGLFYMSDLTFLIDGANSVLLSRLIFCAGHIALCQVTYCELTVLKERKKIKMEHMYTTVTKVDEKLWRDNEVGNCVSAGRG